MCYISNKSYHLFIFCFIFVEKYPLLPFIIKSGIFPMIIDFLKRDDDPVSFCLKIDNI